MYPINLEKIQLTGMQNVVSVYDGLWQWCGLSVNDLTKNKIQGDRQACCYDEDQSNGYKRPQPTVFGTVVSSSCVGV